MDTQEFLESVASAATDGNTVQLNKLRDEASKQHPAMRDSLTSIITSLIEYETNLREARDKAANAEAEAIGPKLLEALEQGKFVLVSPEAARNEFGFMSDSYIPCYADEELEIAAYYEMNEDAIIWQGATGFCYRISPKTREVSTE